MIDAWMVVSLVQFGIVGVVLLVLAARRPKLHAIPVRTGHGHGAPVVVHDPPALDWRRYGMLLPLRCLFSPPDTTGFAFNSPLIGLAERFLRILPVDGVMPRFLALSCALRRVGSSLGGKT